MGIPDHLTHLRNLYAGQEATVRTGHGTMNWFQIGKGVHRGCILLQRFQFSCSDVSNSLRPHDCSTSGFLVHQQLPEVAQTHAHQVGDAIHPTISSSIVPFSFCLQSFPESGSFPVSQLFPSGVQSTGASALASVLPVNIQDWFLLGLTGLISLQSKGLSRVFSNTHVKNINSSMFSHLYGPTLSSLHDYWKTCSFDNMGLCQPSDVCAF